MDSSRIFVKNLPPSITDGEIQSHFGAKGRQVTDVKLIPNRRIAFVGYKTAEEAQKAIKYFNRSFIRMSRISVEIAKPVRNARGCRVFPSNAWKDFRLQCASCEETETK